MYRKYSGSFVTILKLTFWVSSKILFAPQLFSNHLTGLEPIEEHYFIYCHNSPRNIVSQILLLRSTDFSCPWVISHIITMSPNLISLCHSDLFYVFKLVQTTLCQLIHEYLDDTSNTSHATMHLCQHCPCRVLGVAHSTTLPSKLGYCVCGRRRVRAITHIQSTGHKSLFQTLSRIQGLFRKFRAPHNCNIRQILQLTQNSP